MKPTPDDPRPPYRRIADRLRDDIHAGRLKPGDRLPSERQLQDEYGTAYATARQAIGVLKSAGLVDSVQGIGHFVRQPVPVVHRRHGTGHFATEARAQGLDAEQRLIEVSTREAPPEVAALLELGDEAPQVILRRNVLLLDDHPVQLTDSHFPAALFGSTRIAESADTRAMPGGPHAEMWRLGWRLDHATEDVSARMPTPQETQALRLAPGVPVVRIVRTTFAIGPGMEEPRPVDVTDYVLSADRHVLSYYVPIREQWSEEEGGWVPKPPA